MSTLQATEYKSTLAWINELTLSELAREVDNVAGGSMVKYALDRLDAVDIRIISKHVQAFYTALEQGEKGEMRYHLEQAFVRMMN
jgi:hypothetical protein